MKGKRHTTEAKVRILRAADGGKNIVEDGSEKNISEQTFQRWKRQFGMMETPSRHSLTEITLLLVPWIWRKYSTLDPSEVIDAPYASKARGRHTDSSAYPSRALEISVYAAIGPAQCGSFKQ